MKIWIDGYEANVEQRVGSGQVAFNLLENLEKLDHKNDYTILLPSPPLSDLPKEREGFRYKLIKPGRFKTLIGIPLAIYFSNQKPDLFFSPTQYIPRFINVKRVMTIFDLAFLHFPQMFTKKDFMQLKSWTEYSIKNCSHIITISKFSKKDITKTYGVDKDKVAVAYPGFDDKLYRPISDHQKISSVLERFKISGKYVIFIGTIQPRKNLIRLMEATKRIEDIKVVVVGKTKGTGREGWMFDTVLGEPKKLGIEDRVIFTGFVPNEDLPYLIAGSEAFTLPSLYEGFGIPVVEAMACGVPVIISNVSSLPEIVGKAGLLVNPTSVDQIEQAIRTVLTDKKLKNKLIRLGLKQAKNFSWNKMARKVIKVFTHLS